MKIDDILTYHEMCAAEGGKVLQQGMNFRINPAYSLILLSQHPNAPYKDKVYEDGVTIEYEGHDVSSPRDLDSKTKDQQEKSTKGTLTQNGKFIKAVQEYKKGKEPEVVKAYEKLRTGIWSFKGYFNLVDYKVVHDGKRNVFRFILRLADRQENHIPRNETLSHTRLIPSSVKVEVWKRDGGKCVLCGSAQNLHFDHDLAFSKGGTSLSGKNVRILCMKHNLEKSNKIE